MNRLTCERIETFIYTTTVPNNATHNCVVAVNRNYAVTFKHGPHETLREGNAITLYNVQDDAIQIQVVVSHVSPLLDFIILRATTDFPSFPNAFDSIYCGKKYFQVGLNKNRQITWKEGIISEQGPACYIGTSHAVSGDSGSGIFSTFGCFMGISVGKKNFVFSNLFVHDTPAVNLSQVAEHYADTQILPVLLFSNLLGITLNHAYQPT